MSEHFINKYCMYSHKDGYVVWKDHKSQVGSEFSRSIDIRDDLDFIKLRFFTKKEVQEKFKSFKLQTEDLKVRVFKIIIQTIDLSEIDEY